MRFIKALLPTIVIIVSAPAAALECFDSATSRYSLSRVALKAPYNSVYAVANNKKVDCRLIKTELHEYMVIAKCANGFRYEVGTTEYCTQARKTSSCDKAVIASPQNKISYVTWKATGSNKSCLNGGGRLEIKHSLRDPSGKEIIITSRHDFRS
jgi:hypothetical protein